MVDGRCIRGHKLISKGRAELKFGASETTFHEEADFDGQKCLPLQKSLKNTENRLLRQKNEKIKISVKHEKWGIVGNMVSQIFTVIGGPLEG